MGVLDPVAIDNLREMVGGDPKFMTELIDTFLEDAPSMWSDMHQALKSGDAVMLHRAAHTFKSNSSEFGATALSNLCRELEVMGEADSLEGTRDLLARVEAEFAQVKAELEAVRQEL
jgi:HPt (histidine-containing phosphotransfer) domain-containing protein